MEHKLIIKQKLTIKHKGKENTNTRLLNPEFPNFQVGMNYGINTSKELDAIEHAYSIENQELKYLDVMEYFSVILESHNIKVKMLYSDLSLIHNGETILSVNINFITHKNLYIIVESILIMFDLALVKGTAKELSLIHVENY